MLVSMPQSACGRFEPASAVVMERIRLCFNASVGVWAIRTSVRFSLIADIRSFNASVGVWAVLTCGGAGCCGWRGCRFNASVGVWAIRTFMDRYDAQLREVSM